MERTEKLVVQLVLTPLIGWQQIGDHCATHGIHQGLEKAQTNGHIDLPTDQGEGFHQAAGRVAENGEQGQPQYR